MSDSMTTDCSACNGSSIGVILEMINDKMTRIGSVYFEEGNLEHVYLVLKEKTYPNAKVELYYDNSFDDIIEYSICMDKLGRLDSDTETDDHGQLLCVRNMFSHIPHYRLYAKQPE